MGTCLVVQWLRIHPAIQGTWVRSLIGEEYACLGHSKAHMLQLVSPLAARSHMTQGRSRVWQLRPDAAKEMKTTANLYSFLLLLCLCQFNL